MDRLDTIKAANRGSKNEKQRGNYTSTAYSQRQQILDWLILHNTLTTLQARKELDIMHPAARIQELREQGHNIITYWATEDTGKGCHRVARYVLLMRVANE